MKHLKTMICVVLAAILMVCSASFGFGPVSAAETEASYDPQSKTLENVRYVMIYNPLIFDEDTENAVHAQLNASSLEAGSSTLTTGSMSSQIIVGFNRADGLDELADLEFIAPWSQREINEGFDDSEVNYGGSKGGFWDYPEYSVGDQEEFYHDTQGNGRTISTFTCTYAGEHCYIWSLEDAIGLENSAIFGDEFDNHVYDLDTAAFGQGRFTEEGGKVHVLFYPFHQDGVGGFFTTLDIYASDEVSPSVIQNYGLNVDKAIINLNSLMVEQDFDFSISTLAHEYQHQICATDRMENYSAPWMRTWLNEAMSAFAEEMIYPGIKGIDQGMYNLCYYVSEYYTEGQSLYDFYNTGDDYIGSYGAVFLFEEWLRAVFGNEIFSHVHEYWRYISDQDSTEADALIYACSQMNAGLTEQIEGLVSMPGEMDSLYQKESERWMAKLIYLFYLDTLNMEFAKLGDYEEVCKSRMVYSGMDPVEIEGGGRIIVATANGSYQIPADASPYLYYVGLDENMNPVIAATP